MTHKHIDGYDVFSHYSKPNEWGTIERNYTADDLLEDMGAGVVFVALIAVIIMGVVALG